MTLTTYSEFLQRVETLGFMALSNLLPGVPSLAAETPASLWHTGLETDPWRWKDRAAEEKRLAFGCILGGHKGFVAARLYPVFYAACHPALTMPERWAAGSVSQATWQVWQLFEKNGTLNTHQVRKLVRDGAERATQELQRDYYITVCGNERKISANGLPYGWPSNRYCRVLDWAPPGWLVELPGWEPSAAQETILEEGVAMSQGVERKSLARKLGW